MIEQCSCKFVFPGVPMDHRECKVHTQAKYKCDECRCDNYRPKRAPTPLQPNWYGDVPFNWSLCTCGHIAQSHN